MKKNLILLLSVLMVAGMAYGQKTVYFNSDYAENPFRNIKQIAILPFATPISSQHNLGNERIRRRRYTTQVLSMNQLKQLQNSRAFEFQNDLYSSLLEKAYLHDKIQNTKITNSLLNKNKINIDSLQNYMPSELAKLLNVDAILYGSITQRISGYGRHSSNIIHFVISLNDKTNGSIIFPKSKNSKNRKIM